ncbi:MAG TPA: arginase family protein, partial [Allosphingosinicella sp.]|nr:arginase family protein [Allosphingosinicella sp.]
MKRAVPDMTGAGTKPRIRLIGLPTDSHSSFLRGAAAAPEAIRRAFGSDHSNRMSERGIEIGVDALLEDAGDLPLTEGEGDVDLISDAVEAIARDGCVPLCLGGDHMVTYPIVR